MQSSRNGVVPERCSWSEGYAAMRSKTINGGAVGTIPVNGNQGHDTAVMPDIVNADHSFAKNDSDRES